ncbi:MAG: glycosyltransferase [Alphaproteobacteria bacterium]|nr:glycosyltransferase [Alphaproteobacteria bacterium]
MSEQKVIAFFPEAAFGPALNSVGIAQACEKMGHKAVFLTDPGMAGVYSGYGFEEHMVNMSEPMAPEEMAKYWQDFINGHIPNFNKDPYDQIDNYVKECWEAIVETAKWAEKDLPSVLAKVKPDLICVDNVILFPAIKQFGKPWVRIISCSENEIEDENIPPHLSGCWADDPESMAKYRAKFNEVIKPAHDDFNGFLKEWGEDAYPLGQVFEASPYLNMLLYPKAIAYDRKDPLDPARFQYLEGCVRKDEDYTIPEFKKNNDKPIIYISFGSLGSGDTDALKRLMNSVAKMPVRVLMNVGDYIDAYDQVPDNVHIASWYPQPSVIPQMDAVIHHGGNNSFTECLYFGVPAIIMPYVWDGHDNASRVHETGHGFKMHRQNWTEEELHANITSMLNDQDMKAKLKNISQNMQKEHGPTKAATLLDNLLKEQG